VAQTERDETGAADHRAAADLEAVAAAESRQRTGGERLGTGRSVGLVLGPALFLVILALPVPEGLAPAAWRVAAAGLLMAVWWMTEAVPIPVTALIPLVLFPILGIGDIRATAAPYAHELIFLFLGGFIIALAMQRWGLHRRIALAIIHAMGTRPTALVAGFMAASALLSMWVSNTATALMMLPIGLSVVQLAGPAVGDEARPATRNFSVALMLGIAYGCSLGGMATLIGTPTNAFLSAFLMETYGFRIAFVDWMKVGVPLMLVGLPLTHAVLTRLVHPVRMRELPGGAKLIEAERARLGPMSRPERSVAAVFATVALLWVFQPLVARVVPGASDTGIAMFGALALFLVPVSLRQGRFVLDWETAEKLPWGVLLLFGGGLTLAGAVARTGLADWLGTQLGGVGAWPAVALVLLVAGIVVMLTELTSNTATAAAFLPVMAALALGIGENPLLLAVPTVLAASCAFMLPVATPPNAIVYSSGVLTIPQMARAGIVLNLVFILVITAVTYTLGAWAFGIEPGVAPAWAVR
jgi:sodium-dependent dicarboxylate transporter 2/3/5